MPILIRGNAASHMVSPSVFSNEEELELVLAHFPNLLRSDSEPAVVLIDRQVNLPEAGKLDLLLVTTEGLPIAVEVKLARNAQSRREVVAQAIDYLSALTALTVDELDEMVKGKLRAALNNLAQEHEGEFSVDLVWKAVGTNLRAGQARLVVVLDEAHPGLERIFHFLARNSKLDVQLFTVQRYRSNGDEVFVPRILVNPASEDDSAAASAKPQKSFDELLGACTNPAEVKFFREKLGQNPRPRTDAHGNVLAYPASGTIRWYVEVKKDCARVIQIGRFQNDESRWGEKLSAPDFGYGRAQKILKFSLITSPDFTFFQDAMDSLAPAFLWQQSLGDNDDDQPAASV